MKKSNTANNDKEYYILLSSNHRKEYIIDSLETIAFPKGFIQHYRYELGWVDSAIKDLLKLEGEKLDKNLLNKDLIIGMLFQKEVTYRNYLWEDIIPIRYGKLKYAYKTGDGSDSVAHFYFELGWHIKPLGDFFNKIQIPFGNGFNKIYAKPLKIDSAIYLTEQKDKALIFNELCSNIDKIVLKNEDGSKNYCKPLYLYIDSFRDNKGNNQIPKYNELTRKAYYELIVGKSYCCHYYTYSTSKENYEIIFNNDAKCFSTPEEYKTVINAKYDKNAVDIVPTLLDKKIISVIKINVTEIRKNNKHVVSTSEQVVPSGEQVITTSEQETNTNKKPVLNNEPLIECETLDLSLPIPVLIKPKTWPKIVELIGEIALMILTVFALFSKLFNSTQNYFDDISNSIIIFINYHFPLIILITILSYLISKSMIKFLSNK